jgi:DNA-binding transcriptional LysR family regulator
MLDAAKLATLSAVVAHGSFSAAARALSLTQPAVSRQVALLEAQLGMPLVRRTRQGTRPTEAGRLLAGHAMAVEQRLALAEAQLAELAGLRRGRVRLGSFFTAFAQLTPEVQALADERLPGIELRHELVDRATAFARLTSDELDAAIVFEHPLVPQPAPAGVDLIPLFADPARVLLAAGHPLAARNELRCADLAGEAWIRAHEGGAAREVDAVLARAGMQPPLLAAGHGDEPVEAQVYVVAGAGIALAYDLNVIVNNDGIAIRALLDGLPRAIQAAVPQEAPPATRAVVALLRQLGGLRHSSRSVFPPSMTSDAPVT